MTVRKGLKGRDGTEGVKGEELKRRDGSEGVKGNHRIEEVNLYNSAFG